MTNTQQKIEKIFTFILQKKYANSQYIPKILTLVSKNVNHNEMPLHHI